MSAIENSLSTWECDAIPPVRIDVGKVEKSEVVFGISQKVGQVAPGITSSHFVIFRVRHPRSVRRSNGTRVQLPSVPLPAALYSWPGFPLSPPWTMLRQAKMSPLLSAIENSLSTWECASRDSRLTVPQGPLSSTCANGTRASPL